MPLFQFDEGTRASAYYDNPNAPSFSDALTISDSGVTFTWSVSTADGRTSIKHEPGARFGHVRDYLEAKNIGGPGDVFTLSSEDNQFEGDVQNPVRVDLKSVFGEVKVQFFEASHTVTRYLNATGTVSAEGMFNQIVFTTNGEFRIDSLETIVKTNCFLEGTHLATPDGQSKIEDLSPGDMLRRSDGGATRVVWVARQRVFPRFRVPSDINPICILAGALADGVPSRNLYLTADHALAIDGMLVNAGALVNGRTIFQMPNMPVDGFVYYHVETDTHEIILAENTPAETFIDNAGRDDFDNLGDHPDPTLVLSELDWPRVASQRLVPREVVSRLNERAEVLALKRAS